MKNIFLGLKQAWIVPSLPTKVSEFYSHIFTRIFRFIGGITVLITISKGFDHIQLQNYFSAFISEIIIISTYLFSFIFIVFTLTINFIKIFYTIYLILKKPEIFEIKKQIKP